MIEQQTVPIGDLYADLVGISDIANEAGVSRACVCNWAKRWPDFPAPVRVLAMGPIYSNAAVQAWRERHGK